jgi:hypothetical protein
VIVVIWKAQLYEFFYRIHEISLYLLRMTKVTRIIDSHNEFNYLLEHINTQIRYLCQEISALVVNLRRDQSPSKTKRHSRTSAQRESDVYRLGI